MSFAVGTRLGPYEIQSIIGAGGMGEVYRARDTRLGRTVALKTLHGGNLERFAREARAIAALNHPNICVLYDIRTDGEIDYLVMEYIEGAPLKGPLPHDEALQFALQISSALEAAHNADIVHRDLKPANILVTPKGVKLLDFGIAKIGSALTDEMPQTRPGTLLGTAAYMSPEQAQGNPVDNRSDIFSFGAVLYEMLSGERAFSRETEIATAMAILYADPSPLQVPPELERIVTRCLQKAPGARFQAMAEVSVALENLRNAAIPLAGARGSEPPILSRDREGAVVDQAAPRPGIKRGIPKTLLWSVLGACIPLIGLFAWLTVRAKEERSSVVKPQELPKTISKPKELPNTISDPNGQMHLVPAGDFIFGSELPESPNKQQVVNLPAFYIDETEVSNRAYQRFCDAKGHSHPDSPDFLNKPNLPVVYVSLADAKNFCEWAGKRLPTESEWEKAARGTDGRKYPWGNETMKSPTTLQPVEALPERQSPYGILNMAGNVWEWTLTRFPASKREFVDMKRLLKTNIVSEEWYSIKGGSFPSEQEQFFRCFMRRGFPNDQKSEIIGFRCIKDAN